MIGGGEGRGPFSRGKGRECSEGKVRVLGHGRSEMRVGSGEVWRAGQARGGREESVEGDGVGDVTQKSHGTSDGGETAAGVGRSTWHVHFRPAFDRR